jgi:DNA mismatch endonuclease (patch repair protein)
MARIRVKDTKPELIVRTILQRMGVSFRLHHKDLPGKPDVVLPRRKKIIFIHGCLLG